MAKNYLTPAQIPALIKRAEEYATAGGYCYKRDRAAVTRYIREIIERAARSADDARYLVECGLSHAAFSAFLLAGARSWGHAAESGCFFADTLELSGLAGRDFIAEYGEDEGPARAVTWQGGILTIAARALFAAYSDLRTARRQFYAIRTKSTARRGGGAWISFDVYEYRDGISAPAGMQKKASGRYCSAGCRGDEHEAAAALVKAGALPANALTPSGYFNAAEYGENGPLCAYCTFETLA